MSLHRVTSSLWGPVLLRSYLISVLYLFRCDPHFVPSSPSHSTLDSVDSLCGHLSGFIINLLLFPFKKKTFHYSRLRTKVPYSLLYLRHLYPTNKLFKLFSFFNVVIDLSRRPSPLVKDSVASWSVKTSVFPLSTLLPNFYGLSRL